MYKTKDQLLADGYTDFQYFGRKYLWLWTALTILFITISVLTIRSVQNPDFGQDLLQQYRDQNQVHSSRPIRRGQGWIFLILLFLTLPIFVKLPTAMLLGAKLAANIRWGFWHTLNRQPDLALGPNGVYFPDKYRFGEINWNQVTNIYCERNLNLGATQYLTTVTFVGWPNNQEKEEIKSVRPKVLFRVPRRWGMDGEAIIYYIQENVPHVKIEIKGSGRI